MQTLVTGASGLIGANLCRVLLRRGHTVRALVRKNSDLAAINGLPVELIYGDILRPETLFPAAAGCEWIFHTAAIFAYWGVSEDELDRTAVEGASNMLLAAKA